MKVPIIIRCIATAVIVIIVGQTLFFKFSGAEESVELFTTLGLEPHGRISIGIAELVAIILLLVPRTAVYGALLTAGLMAGALFSHITKLGFAGEMGSLAALAVVALAAACILLWQLRRQLPVIGSKFAD